MAAADSHGRCRRDDLGESWYEKLLCRSQVYYHRSANSTFTFVYTDLLICSISQYHLVKSSLESLMGFRVAMLSFRL